MLLNYYEAHDAKRLDPLYDRDVTKLFAEGATPICQHDRNVIKLVFGVWRTETSCTTRNHDGDVIKRIAKTRQYRPRIEAFIDFFAASAMT